MIPRYEHAYGNYYTIIEKKISSATLFEMYWTYIFLKLGQGIQVGIETYMF